MRARARHLWRGFWLGIGGLLVAPAGCNLIAGIDGGLPLEATGSAGAGQGGQGGAGGAGGAGGTIEACKPSETRACYDGAPETSNVGACLEGTQTCKMDGAGYGPCEGQVVPATEDCNTPVDESCDGTLDDGPPECPGSVLWSRQIAGTAQQIPLAAAVDYEGNLLVAGTFEGEMTAGDKTLQSADKTDAFLIKYNANGDTLFAFRFGGLEDQVPGAVAADMLGNTFVVGSFTGSIDFGGPDMPLASAGMSDIFMAKLDSDGNVLWKKQFGDAASQYATGVAVDPLGNVLVVGRFEGVLDLGASTLSNGGAMNAFMIKLGPNGDPVWGQQFGDASEQSAESVAVDAVGNVLLAGMFAGSIDFGDGQKVSSGGYDAFLAKFGLNGNLIWSEAIGGFGEQHALSVAADPVGDIVLTGHFSGLADFGGGLEPGVGGKDMFIVKHTSAGAFSWKLTLGSSDDDLGLSVATDGLSNILVSGVISGALNTGEFNINPAGGRDAFLAKLDPTGAPLWVKVAGDIADQEGTGVAVDQNGDALWIGPFMSTIKLGPASYTSTSAELNDGFVAKLLH